MLTRLNFKHQARSLVATKKKAPKDPLGLLRTSTRQAQVNQGCRVRHRIASGNYTHRSDSFIIGHMASSRRAVSICKHSQQNLHNFLLLPPLVAVATNTAQPGHSRSRVASLTSP